ncbi:TPA: DUF551 domain-containing protein [Klebsiella pneumoniae]|uniref:DUF551 domain-containing protein n=1 Tax=Klebsiella pneumoniae TaxID=573 RepID=UPI002A4E26B9|nr:DUF551 domain-containing protein [Klebsiella pneumoniae]
MINRNKLEHILEYAKQQRYIGQSCKVPPEDMVEIMERLLSACNSPAIPDGWTGNDKANAALMMLDRIETVDPVDDDRIDGIKRIVRELAAAPHDTPALNSVQSVDSVADRWIPVSERMPIEFEAVIAFDGDQVYGEAMYSSDDGFTIDGYEPCDRLNLQNVTHWMPLPAAPQEVKGE